MYSSSGSPPSQVDMEAFATMSNEDLLDIGIEDAEHRLKLLNIILKLNRQQVSDMVPLPRAGCPTPLRAICIVFSLLQKLRMIAWFTRSHLPPRLMVCLLHLCNGIQSMHVLVT